MNNCRLYLIEWAYTEDFPGRPVPIVYLADGKPGYVINQWVYWLVEEGITPSSLEKRILHVMSLYDFHYRKYGGQPLDEQQAKHLIREFLEAKKNGSELMQWRPIFRRATIEEYLSSINLFDEWQATFHGGTRLNPSEERFMTTWEIYSEWQHREQWDAMLHLFPSTTKTIKKHKYVLDRFEHKRFKFAAKKIPKAFPIEKFVELVEYTPNPRDQMAWLLMGGGSLRKSELLHLFYEDIRGIGLDGAMRIRLDDPETGEWCWQKGGNLIEGTRSDYLNDCFTNEQFKFTKPELYKLRPRTQGKRGANHAGWKGVTFSETPEAEINVDGRLVYPHEIWWCNPAMGIRFIRACEEYISKYFYNKPTNWPYHPWLFINTSKEEFGLPWTLKSLDRAWSRALKRIGMEGCGLGPHSLRHMYGSYCASVLQLPLETTRTLMHHANITSTQAYYHIRSETVQRSIAEAIKSSPNKCILNYLIMPGSEVQLPKNWNDKL